MTLVFIEMLTQIRRRRLTPLREFAMVRFMNILTDKPGWDTKVYNCLIWFRKPSLTNTGF
jgi:hypothetical protein